MNTNRLTGIVAAVGAGPRGPRAGTAFTVALLTMLPTVLLSVAAGTGADSTTIASATLPTARYGTSAVWDGSNAYLFGGIDGNGRGIVTQIARYSPATDTVTTMTATLPTARSSTSAVWAGSNAYIFGGHDGRFLNQIVRYNPASDTATPMTATLPTALVETSAVWDGENAYIFGGSDGTPGGGIHDEIVRYNPATDTVTTMAATLPMASYFASAVWDGENAYIFGGRDSSGMDHDRIVRYHPATDTVTTVAATLPTARLRASAVWDGANAYLFGGHERDSQMLSQIVQYNPASDAVSIMTAILPSARIATSAVWDGTSAHVFGGDERYGGPFLNEIVRYDPPIEDPNAAPVCAGAGPTIDSIWPPNHMFVAVSIEGVTDPDGDSLTVRITSVHQDEPVDAVADGSTGPDARGSGGAIIDIRAERAGDGNGRVYHLGFEASDGRGGSCAGVAHVEVPRRATLRAIDDGPAYDSGLA